MKLHIHAGNTHSREELRTLLIDAADQLVGDNHQVLETKLPWDGNPVLMADAIGHPVLISFEPENSQTALINGLAGIEQLSAALPWINQVYVALNNQQLPPRLIIVSSETPPGTSAVLAACPNLDLFTYKILRINGDTGLWLERQQGSSGTADACRAEPTETPVEASPVRSSGQLKPVTLPELSEEESSYFQQL